MNKLLVIDPQNDFCDSSMDSFEPALPIPGSTDDIKRLSAFVKIAMRKIGSITVTLDSHPSVAIERPAFWIANDGSDVPPSTVISYADVRDGKYLPRQIELLGQARNYVKALEAEKRYQLTIWPTHCVLGTWGHAVPPLLSVTLSKWERQTSQSVSRFLKGMNPLTEHYSAIRAEVPCDITTDTNYALLAQITPTLRDYLFVAGEASSHCVKATMLDLFPTLSPDQIRRVVLLTDCMSPMTGFEDDARAFLEYCRRLGVLTLSSKNALRLLELSLN